MIKFTAYGEPRTAGSKRAFALRRRDGSLVTRAGGSPVINVTEDNAKSKDWRRTVAWSAREVFSGELLRCALKVEFTFYRPRPKGHHGVHGLSKTGRETPFPIGRPDVLKLARAAEDALTGVVWNDDAQIVLEVLRKEWGEPARLECAIEAMQPQPLAPQQLDIDAPVLVLDGAAVPF